MVTIGTSEEACRSASANRAEAVARVLPSRPPIAVALLSATAASTLRRPPQPTEPVRRGSRQWQAASSGRVNIALGTDEAARGSAALAEGERDRTGRPCAQAEQLHWWSSLVRCTGTCGVSLWYRRWLRLARNTICTQRTEHGCEVRQDRDRPRPSVRKQLATQRCTKAGSKPGALGM